MAHSLDRVVNHGKPVRAIKSAKTCFVVSAKLDQTPLENPGFDQALGHPLELVPVLNPVTPMGPGKPLKVRVDFKGKPLANTVVSFVPQGETLKEGFDERYERKTDAAGLASNESAEDYQETAYAATLTVFVPEVCPCCGD